MHHIFIIAKGLLLRFNSVWLNSVRREIVSYVIIVFYDKVRGRNKTQRWLLLDCCGFFIWKKIQSDTFSQDNIMAYISNVVRHFQQYFSFFVEISFIGVGKPEYQEETTDLPPVTDKSHNVVSSTPRRERDSNSHRLVVIGTDGIGVVTVTTIPRR
jgi:hypothetical protein